MKKHKHKNKSAFGLVLFCLETKLLFLLQQKQVELKVFKCSLYFLGEKEIINVYIKEAVFNSEMSICWTKECRRSCAVDALSTVVCMCIKVAALILKIFTGVFFPLSLCSKNLFTKMWSVIFYFLPLLQLLVTFSHPALDLGSWVTVSCSFPSNKKTFPCLVINNKLGASVLKSWETRLVDVWVFWVFQ